MAANRKSPLDNPPDPDELGAKLADLEALGMEHGAYWVKRTVNDLRRAVKTLSTCDALRKEEYTGLRKENERLKILNARLKSSVETADKTISGSQNAFDRFRTGIRLVELMRTHEDLPGILDRICDLFELEAVSLLLDETEYGRFTPEEIRTVPRETLRQAAREIKAAMGERDSFLGDVKQIKQLDFFFGDAVSKKRKAALLGSCFIYPLRDKFAPDRLIGIISFFDDNPKRYTREKLSDFVEHFCDILGYAVVDVTERKKTELLREDVDRMTRHDLKAPLTAVITLPKLFKRDGNLSSRQEDMLDLVQSAGYRMLHMINQSLDLYKMESGVYELDPEPVDLLPILDNIEAELSGFLDANEAALDVVVRGLPRSGDDVFVVRGEEMLCYTMLSNLIRNALEAAEEGERVLISLDEEEAPVVSVHNKAAVPREVRDTFFEKYATAGKRDGTGLGTYGARLMAEVQGGRIAMRTSKSFGTMVTVTFPEAPVRCTDGRLREQGEAKTLADPADRKKDDLREAVHEQ